MDAPFFLGEEHIDAGQHVFGKRDVYAGAGLSPSLTALCWVAPAAPVSAPGSPLHLEL